MDSGRPVRGGRAASADDSRPADFVARRALPHPGGGTAARPNRDPASSRTGQPGAAFSDPFAALALCRFDLSGGATRIRAQADSAHPFSISVRLTDGTIIYSGNDRDTPSGRFNLRIVTQKQADAEDASQGAGDDAGQDAAPSASPDMAASDELRLTSPNLRGFVVFRAARVARGRL